MMLSSQLQSSGPPQPQSLQPPSSPPPSGSWQGGPAALSPPPPPLPPLPPPPVLQPMIKSDAQGQPGGKALNQTFSSVTQETRKACSIFLHSLGLPEEANSNYVFLSSYTPVLPVIQSGPICGLVALAMASDLTGNKHVTTEQIFAEACKRGYSKQGEMFSVSWLQELASHFLTNNVISTALQRKDSGQVLNGQCLVHHLLQGNLILIPYDADKNNGPCQKKGHKAHWALLTGFFVAFKVLNVCEEVFNMCERDSEYPMLYYWPANPDETSRLKLEELVREEKGEMFVFGHQGKSKYAGLWSLDALLCSTDNLVEAGPERVNGDFVLPEGGVETGLKSQVVIIKRDPTR